MPISLKNGDDAATLIVIPEQYRSYNYMLRVACVSNGFQTVFEFPVPELDNEFTSIQGGYANVSYSQWFQFHCDGEYGIHIPTIYMNGQIVRGLSYITIQKYW